MTLDTMLTWQTVCQWAVIVGGLITLVGGAGVKYFDGKIMDDKLSKIEKEVRSIPSRQRLTEIQKELNAKKRVSTNQQRAIKGH